ncbi:MAG: hypothetical protein AB1486_05985 [Planctomycetota bacterium]
MLSISREVQASPGRRASLRTRCRVRFTLVLPVILVLLLSLGSTASGTAAIAETTRQSCTVCHVSPSGGTLLSAGRAYLLSHPSETRERTPSPGETTRRPVRRSQENNEISGTFTLQAGRFEESFSDGSEATYRAYADLAWRVDRLAGREGLSFHGELITRIDEADREVEGADEVAIVTGYVRWADSDGSRVAKVGRQFVSFGPKPLFLDGADYWQQLSDALDVELLAGLPALNGEGGASGDHAAGGRLGWRAHRSLAIGVAALSMADGGDRSYELAGLDARWQATEALELFGHAYYDIIGYELYNILTRASYALAENWRLRADYSRVVPGAALPKTSIFSVISDDVIDEINFDLSYAPVYELRVHGFVRAVFYEEGGDARLVGGGCDYYFGDHREGVLGGELSYTDERRPDAGTNVDADLLTVRAFVRQDLTDKLFSALDATVDLFGGGGYDRNSYFGRFHLGWRFSPVTLIVLGLEYLNTVQYGNRYDTSLKFQQSF